MNVTHFKDLIVWQRGMELVREVYELTSQLPKSEVYGISSQLQRAAVSVPSNIAEGHARNHKKEFVQFLGIAYGSTAELETQLMLVSTLYPVCNTEKAIGLLTEVQKMLMAMSRKLQPASSSR